MATLIRLADLLVTDFDLLEALGDLTRDCVRLVGVTAAALLLVGPRGDLQVVAASSERSRLLELSQLQCNQGPGLTCYRSGEAIVVSDIALLADRWPLFLKAASASGYRAVTAVPMRLRDQVIGALSLFSTEPGKLSDPASSLAQALADMATITILQERAMRDSEQLAAQLQRALTSRVLLEQAKGVLSERAGLTMDEAFAVIRSYARAHNQRVHDVSRVIIDGTLDVGKVIKPEPSPPAEA